MPQNTSPFNRDITISLPVYDRPERTIRALNSILAQTKNNYELLLTGDCCPNMKTKSFMQLIDIITKSIANKGNQVVIYNNPTHTGHWGYEIRNDHIRWANGTYFMFMGSDDILLPDHLQSIYGAIKPTKNAWMYFDTWVEPNKAPRNAQAKEGMIGHSELIVKTDFLQRMPPHDENYGHDWRLIHKMMHSTDMYQKASWLKPTYIVKSIPGKEETGID